MTTMIINIIMMIITTIMTITTITMIIKEVRIPDMVKEAQEERKKTGQGTAKTILHFNLYAQITDNL